MVDCFHTGDHQRPFRLGKPHARALERFAVWRTTHRPGPADRLRSRGICRGDGHRDIDMNRAGRVVERDADRLIDHHVDCVRIGDKAGLCNRTEKRALIEPLMGVGLSGCRLDAAGQDDQGHAILLGVGHNVDRIDKARANGRHQQCGCTGALVNPFRHEAPAVLMLDQHETDAGLLQRADKGQNLPARNPECIANPCLVEALCYDLGDGGHGALLIGYST